MSCWWNWKEDFVLFVGSFLDTSGTEQLGTARHKEALG